MGEVMFTNCFYIALDHVASTVNKFVLYEANIFAQILCQTPSYIEPRLTLVDIAFKINTTLFLLGFRTNNLGLVFIIGIHYYFVFYFNHYNEVV